MTNIQYSVFLKCLIFVCFFGVIVSFLLEYMFSGVFLWSLIEDLIRCESTTEREHRFHQGVDMRDCEAQRHGSSTSARPRLTLLPPLSSFSRQRCSWDPFTPVFTFPNGASLLISIVDNCFKPPRAFFVPRFPHSDLHTILHKIDKQGTVPVSLENIPVQHQLLLLRRHRFNRFT